MSSRSICEQAVIGAGAAGLVAARELQKERHKVTVFEQGDRCGGVWVYTDETEHEDLTGAIWPCPLTHVWDRAAHSSFLAEEISQFS